MIIILVLRAMLWRVPRAIEVKAVPAPVSRRRRLPFFVHLRGCLLPPWPNYGVSRLARSRSRRTRRVVL